MKINERRVVEKVTLLVEFYEKYGREPKAKEEYKGVKIGCFLHNVRSKRIKINEEERNNLEKLGIRLTSKNRQNQVHEKVLLLGE